MLAGRVAYDGAVCRHPACILLGKAASQLGVGAQLTPQQSQRWGKVEVTEAPVTPPATDI